MWFGCLDFGRTRREHCCDALSWLGHRLNWKQSMSGAKHGDFNPPRYSYNLLGCTGPGLSRIEWVRFRLGCFPPGCRRCRRLIGDIIRIQSSHESCQTMESLMPEFKMGRSRLPDVQPRVSLRFHRFDALAYG